MRLMRNASMAILILAMPAIQPISAEEPRVRAFAELEKWLIGTYLENVEEERRRGRGDSRENRMDKRGEMERRRVAAEKEGLESHGTLPPGLKLSTLPRELESKLPPLPESLERVLVGGQVALVEKASRRIQDVFELRQARENGPPAELAVCHVPPGNPSKGRTLSLPEPAIRSHLGHGDYIGFCR